jgi:hypothetical protein
MEPEAPSAWEQADARLLMATHVFYPCMRRGRVHRWVTLPGADPSLGHALIRGVSEACRVVTVGDEGQVVLPSPNRSPSRGRLSPLCALAKAAQPAPPPLAVLAGLGARIRRQRALGLAAFSGHLLSRLAVHARR